MVYDFHNLFKGHFHENDLSDDMTIKAITPKSAAINSIKKKIGIKKKNIMPSNVITLFDASSQTEEGNLYEV